MLVSPAAGPLTVRSWPFRLARVWAVTGVALMISIGGHLLGGGDRPAPAVAAGLFVLLSMIVWRLSNHRLTPRIIAGALLLAQALIHLSCTVASDGPMSEFGPAMLAGHVVATVAAMAVLSRGEALLWRVLEVISTPFRRFRAFFSRAPIRRDPLRNGVWADRAPLLSRISRDAIVVRGPPRALLV